MFKSSATVLGVVLASSVLTGCAGDMKMMEEMQAATMAAAAAAAAAQATADEALRMAKTADHIAFQAKESAATADEIARMAVACCDANAHRLNTEFHGMQTK